VGLWSVVVDKMLDSNAIEKVSYTGCFNVESGIKTARVSKRGQAPVFPSALEPAFYCQCVPSSENETGFY
jgi:hypothetical protein